MAIEKHLENVLLTQKRDRMGKLTQPVFIMWGEQDGFILINIGQRFH
jgi:pimeloyl-ACP methyl ester carboxylesterase